MGRKHSTGCEPAPIRSASGTTEAGSNVGDDRPDKRMRPMLRTPVTAGRKARFRRLALVGAIVSVAVVPVGVGAAIRGEPPTDGERAPAAVPEPRLGVVSSGAPRKPEPEPPQPGRKHAPVVVETLPPGAAPDADVGSDGGPPEHIRRENVKLRRELAHLRALEAERRRVSQALSAAGTIDGSLLVGSGRLIWPITGPLTSPFGPRWGRLHAGIDISAPAGTPIRAADSGRVALAGWQGGYGLYTCVQHTSSLSTCYAHQSRLGTAQGATVRQGQVIGYVGNTGHSFGNHLHFETWVRGTPVDPMGFL
jgi:murein DD-endopeptidase MepM/ murein hydrolase activator NlpD